MKIESNKNWTTCLRLNTGDGSPRVFLLNSHFLGSVPRLALRVFFYTIQHTSNLQQRITSIKIAYGKFCTLFLYFHTIIIVPIAISAHPIKDFTVNVSCKKKKANTSVKTILNLSTAATSVALPI